MIPIKPSTCSIKYPIDYNLNGFIMSYQETMEKILILEKYALIKYMKPFCFLIDPGVNLSDPTDDLVKSILLSNGYFILVEPILVDEAVAEKIEINKPKNMLPIVFDSNVLLFKENTVVNDIVIRKKDVHSQYIYHNEFFVDKELLFDKNIKDNRIKFNIRLNFEEESFELMKFELSKYLQSGEGLIYKQKIIELIEDIDLKLEFKRNQLINILNEIFDKLIISSNELSKTPEGRAYLTEVEKQIGPLNVNFSEIENMPNNPKYLYNYIRPVFKNVCSNVNSIHCYNNKLFINSINLNTSNIYNIENYIKRINEDILRNSLKRNEILNDQINNYFTIIPHIEDEYYINLEDAIEKNINLKKYIHNLYDEKKTIIEKNNEHFDIKNPNININNINTLVISEDENTSCKSDYKLLPEYWIDKLKTNKFMICDFKTNKNTCLFNNIKKAKESLYNNRYLNDLKISIINEIGTNTNYYKE